MRDHASQAPVSEQEEARARAARPSDDSIDVAGIPIEAVPGPHGRCGVCGRAGPLRRATRDETSLCEECWDDYERSCDEEDAYWQGVAHGEADDGRKKEPQPGEQQADPLSPWYQALVRVATARR